MKTRDNAVSGSPDQSDLTACADGMEPFLQNIFHKSCFKCLHCQKILSLGNYASLKEKQGRLAAIDAELAPAYELLTIATNPIPIKAAVNLLGLDGGAFRLPMVPPTDEELARVRDCLSRLGLLVPA